MSGSSPTSPVSGDIKSPFGLPEKESECYRKLIPVLLKILQPNFQASDDTVLPKLLDFIVAQGNQSAADHEVLTRILCEWLKKVDEGWETVQDQSKVFALKLAGYVVSTSKGHARLASTETLCGLLAHFNQTCKKNSSGVDLGYLYLMESLLKSADGAPNIVHSGVWRKIVTLALTSPSIYCVRQSIKFLSNLLVAVEEPTAQLVVDEITAVVYVPTLLDVEASPSVLTPTGFEPKIGNINDELVVNTLSSCRSLVSQLMDAGHPVDKIKSLFGTRRLSDWAWTYINTGESVGVKVFQAANKFVCALIALNFYQNNKNADGLIPLEKAKNIIDVLLNHLSSLAHRGLHYHLNDACLEYQTYAHKHGALVSGEKYVDDLGKNNDDVPNTIHNIIFLLQSMPVLLCLKARKASCLFEDYIDKLFRMSNSAVTRACYGYRKKVNELGEQVCVLGVRVLQSFTHICSMMRKEQGILLFQGCVHLLSEFIALPEETVDARNVLNFNIVGEELITKHPAFLSAALNCLYTYLTHFKFTWTDGLESLGLLCLLQKVLKSKAISHKVTVEILRVIDVAIQGFLPPNLALLVDTIKGSTLDQLGSQLYRLLHSIEWSVRDTTLEVVKTISGLAESQFPAFQTLLIENKLPEVVFSIIESDHEPFVRASAISCLTELADVPKVWRATLSDKNVICRQQINWSLISVMNPQEKLLQIVHYDSEGIVRVAAVRALRAAYLKKYPSPKELDLMYNILSHTAQNDLHWEVKVSCLEFWRAVMADSIGDQGMIDGVFPEVVFSKQQKKIVRLTHSEKGQRVLDAIKTLERVGCLQVLWDTFSNEPDLVVQQKSGFLLKKILDRRAQYPGLFDGRPEPPVDDNAMDVSEPAASEPIIKMTENTTADSVIEQIVTESDWHLLSKLYNSAEKSRQLPDIKRTIMTSDQFIHKIASLDVEQTLNNREKWLSDTSEGIVSLLDDILIFSTKMDQATGRDRNAIDCY